MALFIIGSTTYASNWPNPDNLQCQEVGEAEEACDTYKWCIFQGELMGNYESSYLKSMCSERAMDKFELSEDELLSILNRAL